MPLETCQSEGVLDDVSSEKVSIQRDARQIRFTSVSDICRLQIVELIKLTVLGVYLNLIHDILSRKQEMKASNYKLEKLQT